MGKTGQFRNIFFALALAPLAAHGAVAGPTLCRSNETILFGCSIGKARVISLCAISDAPHDRTYMQFRSTYKANTFRYPNRPYPSPQLFWFSWTPYSGGGEYHVRFVSGSVEYTIYNYETRGDTYSGLVLKSRNHTAVNLRCKDTERTHLDARVFAAASKEKFVPLPNTISRRGR